MAIELRILSGARGGQTEAFEKSVIAIGRHPMSDLRFDPHQDLDVSTKHAEIRGLDGRYTVYDAGSTNGTFVNGDRVSEPRELRDGDVLTFGAQGPRAAFHVVTSQARSSAPVPPATAPRRSVPPPPPPPPSAVRSSAPATQRAPTTERVAMAVREETRGLRRMLAAAVIVFGGLAAGVWYTARRDAMARDAEIRQLIALNEQTSRDFQTRIRGMNDTALTNALRRRTDSLMEAARASTRATKDRAAIQTDLARNQQLQRAFVEMDLPAVRQANDPAVVLITTDLGQGLEATGFTVAPEGLVITNRHVVADTAGRASRIMVKFANTGEWHRAHIVTTAVGDNNDLALLQIDDRGPFPTVRGVGPSAADVPVGSAIATLGFPLGTDAAMEGSGASMVAKTTLTVGYVSKMVSDRLQLDTYAGHGSSGSPVFDEHGHVIGVIWSGAIGSGGRIVYAVPADRILQLLPPDTRNALSR